MTQKEYYEKELKKVSKNLKGASFKFIGWEDETKELNLNLDSIAVLEDFLKKAKKELKKVYK